MTQLAAVDAFQILILVIFGGIALLSKVLNAGKERGAESRSRRARPARSRPPRPRAARPTDSLEEFLEQMAGGQARPPAKPRPDQVVVVRRRRGAAVKPRSPAAQQRLIRPQKARPPAGPKPKRLTRPSAEVDKPLVTTGGAGAVAAAQRQVERSGAVAAAAAALQAAGSSADWTTRRPALAAALSQMLRSPDTLKHAVVLREILGPPRCRRR